MFRSALLAVSVLFLTLPPPVVGAEIPAAENLTLSQPYGLTVAPARSANLGICSDTYLPPDDVPVDCWEEFAVFAIAVAAYASADLALSAAYASLNPLNIASAQALWYAASATLVMAEQYYLRCVFSGGSGRPRFRET